MFSMFHNDYVIRSQLLLVSRLLKIPLIGYQCQYHQICAKKFLTSVKSRVRFIDGRLCQTFLP